MFVVLKQGRIGMELNEQYWQQRYEQGHTPWDMGMASPPLTGFLQQRYHRQARILIPGAGRAHEAVWLWHHGFTNIWVVDLVPQALAEVQKRLPDLPPAQLIHEDFFALSGRYDLVLEQTFFCALAPRLRGDYARQMAQLLPRGGSLVGLWFDFPLAEGPPFGGSPAEYRDTLAPFFNFYRLERCYNSIPPRQGKELFIHAIRR